MRPISYYSHSEARIQVKNIVEYVLQVHEKDDKKYTELIDRLVLEFKQCRGIEWVTELEFKEIVSSVFARFKKDNGLVVKEK